MILMTRELLRRRHGGTPSLLQQTVLASPRCPRVPRCSPPRARTGMARGPDEMKAASAAGPVDDPPCAGLGRRLMVWPGRLARWSLALFHGVLAVGCVAAVVGSIPGWGGADYSAPPVARSAAQERAFIAARERAVGRGAEREMLKSASGEVVRRCCGGATSEDNDADLLRCANATAPFTGASRVAVVTQATASVEGYARYAAALNAAYAAHHGYSFTVFGDDPNLMPKGYEYRYGKVPLLLRLMNANRKVGLFLWIDADAVVLDHSFEVVARLANRHPGKDIVGCREALLATNNVINSGTLLLRNTPWTRAFLQAWMTQPDARIGAPDQHTFDMLWETNHMGVREKTALLPANEFNSEPPFFETFKTPKQQPVLHLMGENTRVRAGIFGRAWRGLCARSAEHVGGGEGVNPGEMSCAMNANGEHACSAVGNRDWPVHLDWMMAEYSSANRAVAEDAEASARARVEAYNRLGVLLSNGGDFKGRLECHEAALRIKRAEYGHPKDDLHPELAHELQVIGNHYSMFDRHGEAVDVLTRALRINRERKDPKGNPMPHMVSASLGDLANAQMRGGDAKRALESYRMSLDIEMKLYGEVHKNTADTMFNMAMAYDRVGKRKKAATYFEKAIVGYESFLAPEHPALLRARANLNVLKRGGKLHGGAQAPPNTMMHG